MKDNSINKFSVYLAGLSEFARLLLHQRFVLLRDRALIIYCADCKELDNLLDCLGYISDGLTLIADRVVLKAPDCGPIILTEHYCRTLAQKKLTQTRSMLEKIFAI
ncbi:MAG: hypothetical protein QNJ46_08790 [Leptolyngbyaceae cyanobacterium MO_188.B28]|nr:hypothetical protein [Leptolyngbyaceae cyanobacterium MO_188.B28]